MVNTLKQQQQANQTTTIIVNSDKGVAVERLVAVMDNLRGAVFSPSPSRHGSCDMYLLYRSRHLFSWLPALIVAGCLLFASQQAALKIQPRYDETAIELALVEPEPAPELTANAAGPPARTAAARAGADPRTGGAGAGTDRGSQAGAETAAEAQTQTGEGESQTGREA